MGILLHQLDHGSRGNRDIPDRKVGKRLGDIGEKEGDVGRQRFWLPQWDFRRVWHAPLKGRLRCAQLVKLVGKVGGKPDLVTM